MQTHSTLDRKRRDGYAGPGVDPAVSDEDARAALDRSAKALVGEAAALYAAGMYEAGTMVMQASADLRNRYEAREAN